MPTVSQWRQNRTLYLIVLLSQCEWENVLQKGGKMKDKKCKEKNISCKNKCGYGQCSTAKLNGTLA